MSRCTHQKKTIVDESDERILYWCRACGALGRWGTRIDDWHWRLSELALVQCNHPDGKQEHYGKYNFCTGCLTIYMPEEAVDG